MAHSSSQFSSQSDLALCAFLRMPQDTVVQKREHELAFKELYNRHSPRLYAYTLKMTGDPQQAKDLFQEAFMRLYKTIQETDKPLEALMTNVPAFLLRIARNLHLNAKRDAKPTIELEDFHVSVSPANDHAQSELLQLISSALELLDHEHREAFVLREYDGMSYAEIAEITGTNEATAKTRAFRAKEKIRKILQPYLDDVQRH
jgi:RNA polymerase sigma-70 factor (ECF subfamily)